MNSEFYYYAVKFIANQALFRQEASIQKIAETAQFVNENCETVECAMNAEELDKTESGSIIRDRGLYKGAPGSDEISVFLPRTAPLPLAAKDWGEDWKEPDTQWNILVPFHYYPPRFLEAGKEPVHYRTSPCTHAASPESPFHQIRERAITGWDYESDEEDDNEEALLRIGIVCQIIGASFTNDRLNGFTSWVNRAYLEDAWTADLTRRVKHDSTVPADDENFYVREHLWKNISVGHARLGAALTDGGLDIVFCHAKDEGDGTETSDPILGGTRRILGKRLYLAACKEIFHFLLLCNGERPAEHENIWEHTLLPKLQTLYGAWRPDPAALAAKWKTATGLDYTYDAEAIRGHFTAVDKPTEHLFRYVILIDDIRQSVLMDAAQKGKS